MTLLFLLSAAAVQDAEPGDVSTLQAGARFTFPGGAISGIGSVGYHELLGTGIGAELQGARLWRVSRRVSLGAYLEADEDFFPGGGRIPGLFGTTVKTQSSSAFRLLGGAKIREEFGASHFYSEQMLGFGAIFHSGIRGDVSNGMNDAELFARTVRFGMDVGATIGLSVSRQWETFVTLAMQLNGGPGEGRDIAIIAPNFSGNANTQLNFGVTLGLNIRF